MQNCYAAIDLGSNSFHMLIVRQVAGTVQTIGKVKQKVRLAAGLDARGYLSEDAMARGWECLSWFGERLQDIPAEHIRVVGTATLRLAKNADHFIRRAEQILNHPIEVISGEQEAAEIFAGVSYTAGGQEKRLVIDIGGASTEVVAGSNSQARVLRSLNMGCVTFQQRFFASGKLDASAFNQAIAAATDLLKPHLAAFRQHGWQMAYGASGTPQAVVEILLKQGLDERITLAKLHQIRHQVERCGHIDKLKIKGLKQERKAVFAPGLAILLALFDHLAIDTMQLARGALREGLVYGMLPDLQQQDVMMRTAKSLMLQYHVDQKQARRVANLATRLADQIAHSWALDAFNGRKLLQLAALIHEIGLQIDFKNNRFHAGYILTHTDLPGLSLAQQRLLAALVRNYKDDLVMEDICQQTATCPQLAGRLVRLLRLAFILCQRRRDDAVPDVRLNVTGEQLTLCFDSHWLNAHPLIAAQLQQEVEYQQQAGWQLQLTDNSTE